MFYILFCVCSEADVKTLHLQLGLASPEQKDADKSSLTSGKESNSKFQMVMFRVALCTQLFFKAEAFMFVESP